MAIFTVIVPAGSKPLAEYLASQLNPATVGESFVVPLQDGTGAITHWGCQPNMTTRETELALLQLASSGLLPGADVERVLISDLRGAFLATLQRLGLQEVPA